MSKSQDEIVTITPELIEAHIREARRLRARTIASFFGVKPADEAEGAEVKPAARPERPASGVLRPGAATA